MLAELFPVMPLLGGSGQAVRHLQADAAAGLGDHSRYPGKPGMAASDHARVISILSPVWRR